MVIQHNISALNAYNTINSTNHMLKNNQEKLSSGFRINRAGDDAAGLAISEKMRSQIRGLNQAKRNCFDGISLVQTAEGALSTVHSILCRMTELAEESANGTYDDSVDRNALQLELTQLKEEINQIAESTAFGTLNLLDGSLSESGEICIGPRNLTKGEDDLKIYVYDEILHDVDATQTTEGSATMAGYADLKSVLKNQIVPQAVKGITDTFSETFGYLNGSKIGIGLNLYSNSSSTVLASVGMSAGGYLNDINLSYTLNVNMAYLDMDATGNLTDESRLKLESTIAHEMMHALMDEAHTAGMLGRDENFNQIADYPDWFVEGAAQAAGGGRGWVNSIGIDSDSTVDEIKSIISSSANKIGSGSTSSQYATGYLAVMYLGHLASNSMTSAGLADGVDSVLYELKAGSSLDKVISDLTGCTNTSDFESKFADMAADFVADLMDAAGGGSGALVGGLTQTDILPDSNLNNTLFSLDTTNTKVKNDYPDGYNVMSGGGKSTTGVSPDGSTPTPGGTTPDPTPDPDPDPDPGPTPGPGPSPDPDPNPGPGTPGDEPIPEVDNERSSVHSGLVLQAAARSKDTMSLYIDSVSTTTLGLDDVDISTQRGASEAIDIIQSAVNKVSAQRADLGAYQNRLEHKIENLTVTSENLTETESSIRDVDMAAEMSAFLKNKMLLEAGNAMLSQANVSNQSVLSLVS